MIVNNISESFNSYIIKAREKPIIDMLEEIRSKLMTMQYKNASSVSGAQLKLCPKINEKLEQLKYYSRHCTCSLLEMVVFKLEIEVFNLSAKSCSCRTWDITGIPRKHACSAVIFLRGNLEDYVADCYTVEKYKKAYKYGISPINGLKMWPPTTGESVKPPPHKVRPGRP